MTEKPDTPFKELMRYLAQQLPSSEGFVDTGRCRFGKKTTKDGTRISLSTYTEAGHPYSLPGPEEVTLVGFISVIQPDLNLRSTHLLTTDKRVFRDAFGGNASTGLIEEHSFLDPEEQRKLLDKLES
jgi:hypothetical protein